MADSEKNVTKSRKVAGAGSDPLVKYLLLRLHLTGEVTVVDSVRECDNRILLIE
jgi:hypothetical protein